MAKKTQLDRAIEAVEAEIAVLQTVVAKLKAQQPKPKPAAVRRPRNVADVAANE